MRPALAILCLLSACGPREPGANACPQDPGFDRSSVFQVKAVVPPAALRRDLDLPALARLSGGAVGFGKLQGLTVVEHRLGFETTVSRERSRGRLCVWFDKVAVDLSPASVEIFVPREYPDGSCEYEAVLAHEREHERVHREGLEAAVKSVEAALNGAKWLPARGNQLLSDDPEGVEAALNEKLRKAVHPAYGKFKEDLTAAHAELDTPGLYQWVSKRCTGWK